MGIKQVMTFWKLQDLRHCENCNTLVIKIDDETFYCPSCKDELTLCGRDGTCEGIAHNGPFEWEGGRLIANKNGDGCCETCGSGWEWA